MNVAATSKNKPPFFLTAFFLRFLPARPPARALLWASLPAFLLLFNMGVGWLKPSPFTPYLPFVALATSAIALRFKTAGLSIGYAAIGMLILWFIPTFEPGERLWQMGILFNIALTLYIVLLTVEEVELCFEEVQGNLEAHHAASSQIEKELRLAKSQANERQHELEEEIQKLKSEAEQRRIDRVREQSRFELIQSEIELLNSQKEEFITEAREARAAAAAAERQIQTWQLQIEQSEQKTAEWIRVVQAEQDAASISEQHMQTWKVQAEQAALQIQALNNELLDAQAAAGDAQQQIQVWQNLAEQAEQKVVQAQQQIASRSQEWEECKKQWEGRAAEWQEKGTGLEEANGRLQEEVIASQEAILLLQQRPTAIVERVVEKEIVSQEVDTQKVIELQKTLNKSQGLYTQLRSQFQEKADMLSQTRRELFEAQGRLEAIENERLSAALVPDREEARVLENEVNALMFAISHQEDEIIHLESLITSLLSS